MREAISLKSITKRFLHSDGTVLTAVEDVNLTVGEGEFVSIVGPSGCGKTTLLNMISGLIPPSSGEISIYGEPINGIRKNVGYIFQKDALFPWKKVLENVSLALLFRKVEQSDATRMAEEWIKKVGLAGFEKYYPSQLSGGMKKRVSICMTFAYNPDIILMDEPFSGLDVQTRYLMENELLNLWAEYQKSILFITHDLSEAIALSDRVYMISANPGRILKDYKINLTRPRNVAEIHLKPLFTQLYEMMWSDLRGEVLKSYEGKNGTI
jgi:NitT/TauT family transport system ATP-binding protein